MDKLNGIICVASIIVLVGLSGGLEQDMLTIGQYIIYSAIALVALAVTVRMASNGRHNNW